MRMLIKNINFNTFKNENYINTIYCTLLHYEQKYTHSWLGSNLRESLTLMETPHLIAV